jgi:hypothetical protein
MPFLPQHPTNTHSYESVALCSRIRDRYSQTPAYEWAFVEGRSEGDRRGRANEQLPYGLVRRPQDGPYAPSQRLKMTAPLWPPRPMLFDRA